MGCTLQGGGQALLAVATLIACFLADDQLVAGGQVVLQGLAEIGNFARAFIQNYCLIEKVSLQILADVVNVRAQQLQQLQARVAGGDQLVEFNQRLVQQASCFTQVGFRQVRYSALQVARAGITEGQAVLVGRWYA